MSDMPKASEAHRTHPERPAASSTAQTAAAEAPTGVAPRDASARATAAATLTPSSPKIAPARSLMSASTSHLGLPRSWKSRRRCRLTERRTILSLVVQGFPTKDA